MAFSLIESEGSQTLKLAGSVTIRHARELFSLVTDSLQAGNPLTVETAELKDIDTTILQLLCSLRRTVSEVTFAEPSEEFLNALERSHLRRELLEEAK